MSRAVRGRTRDGWLFVAPAVVVLGLFLLLPVLMALWVSFSDWRGNGSPLSGDVGVVGLDNYRAILTAGGLPERDFGTSLRNTFYYVLFVVPIQTALALALAVLVHSRMLRGRGFFRTAFYFPSVTSSVAITVLWLFLFSTTGPVNELLGWMKVHGPNWFQDPRGLVHLLLGGVGVDDAPSGLGGHHFLGVSWWDWLAGPSVGLFTLVLLAAFTTSGTMMLLFVAALNNIGEELDEAGMVDGAGAWQRFRHITLPLLAPGLAITFCLNFVLSFSVFPSAIMVGDPAGSTRVISIAAFHAAFEQYDYAMAAAIAMIMGAVELAVIGLVLGWRSRLYRGATGGKG